MKLAEVELRRVRMPLVTPFRTSFGTQSSRDVLLVKVVTPDGEGWGECVALEEPVYSSEYVEGAHHVLRTHLLPRLLDAPDVTAAKAAVEAAVLDAELRACGISLARHLGGVRDAVDSGVSIGIMASAGALLDAIEGYLAAGYRRVKLKIEPGWDVDLVTQVRRQFADIPLWVDANAAYSLADADHLARLDELGLQLIEQPLPEDDLAGHAELARRITTPICLDESITSADSAAEAVGRGACGIVNVKAGRVGGYLEALRIHDVCAAQSVPVWCGGMLETGIGRAANVALATLPNFTLPGDISASDRYYATDLTEPFVLHDGRLHVPDGPGIGVAPLPDVLSQLTTSVERIRPAQR
jgi:O-succinylbenzoate synthase